MKVIGQYPAQPAGFVYGRQGTVLTFTEGAVLASIGTTPDSNFVLRTQTLAMTSDAATVGSVLATPVGSFDPSHGGTPSVDIWGCSGLGADLALVVMGGIWSAGSGGQSSTVSVAKLVHADGSITDTDILGQCATAWGKAFNTYACITIDSAHVLILGTDSTSGNQGSGAWAICSLNGTTLAVVHSGTLGGTLAWGFCAPMLTAPQGGRPVAYLGYTLGVQQGGNVTNPFINYLYVDDTPTAFTTNGALDLDASVKVGRELSIADFRNPVLVTPHDATATNYPQQSFPAAFFTQYAQMRLPTYPLQLTPQERMLLAFHGASS